MVWTVYWSVCMQPGGSGIPKAKERITVKRKLFKCYAIIVVATLAFDGFAPLMAQRGDDVTLITVMNPAIENNPVDRIPLAPRLDKIDGKTIYLVDVNWGGLDAAYSVFEEIKDWFAKYNPSVNIVIRRKRGMYELNDPALWKEIAEKGHAALVGISG